MTIKIHAMMACHKSTSTLRSLHLKKYPYIDSSKQTYISGIFGIPAKGN